MAGQKPQNHKQQQQKNHTDTTVIASIFKMCVLSSGATEGAQILTKIIRILESRE